MILVQSQVIVIRSLLPVDLCFRQTKLHHWLDIGSMSDLRKAGK